MKTLIFILAMAAGQLQAAGTYTVSFMLGGCSVRPAGHSDWRQVTLFDEIAVGDSLRNDPESRLELIASDGTSVRINRPWSGTLTPAAAAMFSDRGDTRSLLGKLSGSRGDVQQNQPVAIAAVRGKETDAADDAAAAESLPVSDARTEAAALLDEAVRLRARIDALLAAGRNDAAESALQLAEKLSQRALALLEK